MTKRKENSNYSTRINGTIEERFWAKVDKNGPQPDGIDGTCWVWTASVNNVGYGQLKDGPRTAKAHRLSYEWCVGPIPDGLVIDHLCRVRRCVNPDHLQPVPQMVNSQRQGIRINNKSGHRSVHWVAKARKWCVQVTANYKVYSGGHFTNLEDAVAAATKLRQGLHG